MAFYTAARLTSSDTQTRPSCSSIFRRALLLLLLLLVPALALTRAAVTTHTLALFSTQLGRSPRVDRGGGRRTRWKKKIAEGGTVSSGKLNCNAKAASTLSFVAFTPTSLTLACVFTSENHIFHRWKSSKKLYENFFSFEILSETEFNKSNKFKMKKLKNIAFDFHFFPKFSPGEFRDAIQSS